MKRFFLACLVSLVAISHLMVKPFVPGKKITILVPDAFAVKVFNTCAECLIVVRSVQIRYGKVMANTCSKLLFGL